MTVENKNDKNSLEMGRKKHKHTNAHTHTESILFRVWNRTTLVVLIFQTHVDTGQDLLDFSFWNVLYNSDNK